MKQLHKKYMEKIKCLNPDCGIMFYRRTAPGKSRNRCCKGIFLRQKNSVTCSSKCSKEYYKWSSLLKSRKKQEILTGKRKKKTDLVPCSRCKRLMTRRAIISIGNMSACRACHYRENKTEMILL